MLTHTVDETVAIKRAFQIVPKYQLAAPSIARKEQGTVAGKMDRKKKNFKPSPGGIKSKNLN